MVQLIILEVSVPCISKARVSQTSQYVNRVALCKISENCRGQNYGRAWNLGCLKKKMAAERELPVVKPFYMANELYLWLKTLNAGDYKQIKECLCARILRGLGQPKFENVMASVTPTGELISYLKICLLRCVLRCIISSIYAKYSRFPLKEDTVNHWFRLEPIRSVQRDHAVFIMNVDKLGQRRKCFATESQAHNSFSDSLEDDRFELFFHGTNHESAQKIIESGIDLLLGSEKKDFSRVDGFYLGGSFHKALKWSKRPRHGSSAVLVFRVAKIELRGNNNKKGLDLGNPEKENDWQHIVQEFRSGEPDLDLVGDLNERYQFIEGPMAFKHRDSREYRKIYRSYQLCVRKRNCADLFDRSLHSVVFFDK